MKWKYPVDGDTRIVTYFCWLPRYYEGTAYWLTYVTERQTYWGYPEIWITNSLQEGKFLK